MRRFWFVLFSLTAAAVGVAQRPSPNPPVFLYAALGPELATYDVGASSGSNRASGTTMVDGKPVWEGGENTVGVYAIDQKTGEPSRIQNVDSGGTHARPRVTGGVSLGR